MIAVQGVSKTFGHFGARRVQALDAVSLGVRRGETLGLIGPNGAGKTTLLSCLLGFLRPDRGAITVDGKPPDDLSVRARTGYLPERLGFDRDLPGGAFLAFHWRLAGGARSRAKAEVEAAADRIGLAQALFRDPELLFLDEPASGTDPRGVALVRERILEAKARGATIVLNSHQLAEVEKVGDRVVFIESGRLTQSETLRGDQATRRRGLVRVPAAGLAAATAALSREGFEPTADPYGSLRFPVGSDDEMARAIRALALAEIPVYEAKASADLEELFSGRGGP